METQVKRQINPRYIAEVGLFLGIILMMKLTGLSSIPVGPLVMTLTMIPIAIGSMLLGPLAGGILGFFYGIISLSDAISGKSAMTAFFFHQVSPILTVLLCIGTRTAVGAATGWLFKLFHKIDRHRIWCYFAGGLAAPLLNTILFMGFIVVFFYHTEFVQNLVKTKEASGPLMFVVLTVGVQGLIEWAAGLVIGGGVGKGVAHALRRDEPTPLFKPVTVMKDAAEEPKKAEEPAEATEKPKEE